MTTFTADPKKPIVWNWINRDLEIDSHEIQAAIEHERCLEKTDLKLGFGGVAVGTATAAAILALAGIGFAMVPPLGLAIAGGFHCYNAGIQERRRELEGEFLDEYPGALTAIEAKLNQGEGNSKVASAYEAMFRAYRRGDDGTIAKVLEATKSQQAFQPTEVQNSVTAGTPTAVPAVTELQPIAAVPSMSHITSPNLALPKTRLELIDRLKQDCPLLLKLVKSHPIRAVGVQRSGKTTLVKTLTLLRMALMEGHSVVASTPHYEAANPYPEAFDVVGVTPDGRRDYPAIERAWYRMASDVESCQKGNVTYIWDEFGLQDKAIPITPDNDPIKTVLTSCLRETMKFEIYPIFILHGETAAFLPGSKGLVTVIMASTVRVETIGEAVEGDDGLEMMRPTGRFNVTWLDGSKGEGVLPTWLSEEYLMGMIEPRERASQKPTAPFITTQLPKTVNSPSISRATIDPTVPAPTASPMGSGRRPTRIRLGASSATPDRAWSTVPVEKVPTAPLDPAIELINAEPDIDRRDALTIAYLWAQAKLDKGEEVSRSAFLERARKERKSEYLITNRDEVWEDLQTLLD